MSQPNTFIIGLPFLLMIIEVLENGEIKEVASIKSGFVFGLRSALNDWFIMRELDCISIVRADKLNLIRKEVAKIDDGFIPVLNDVISVQVENQIISMNTF